MVEPEFPDAREQAFTLVLQNVPPARALLLTLQRYRCQWQTDVDDKSNGDDCDDHDLNGGDGVH